MKYNKNNPLRVFEAFGGYGSQSLALQRLKNDYPQFDFKVVGYSDIEPAAIKAYMALHEGEGVENYGDICKIDWSQTPDFDLFTYSFPCTPAGTFVKTFAGYRKIEDIQIGDLVLTHKNRYMMVTKTMSRNAPSIFDIKGVGCHIRLTGEHPLFVLRDGKFQWVKAKELRLTDKLTYNIPQNETDVDIKENVLWLLGRYVADGWVNPHLYKSVEFGIGKEKEDGFKIHIPNGWDFKTTSKSCIEYRIANGEFQQLCLEFGCGATKKKLPHWIFDLPIDKLSVFLDGYFSGDGHLREIKKTKVQMFSSASKELVLGIQLCLLKVHKKVCSISVRHDERKESFNDTWNAQMFLSDSLVQGIVEDKCCVAIRTIKETKGSIRVYNISVEEDESYTCDNIVVHNCQDISNAGVQRGFEKDSGTRSSLLWECERAIEYKRPKYLLMENVKALTQKKFMPDFNKWLQLLESYGYVNFWSVLNSKNFGVPQNRERVFCVSIRDDGDNPKYHFPNTFPLEICLADILEDEVDEKYFLRDEMLARFCEKSQDNDPEQKEIDFEEWLV